MKTMIVFFGVLALASIASAASDTCITRLGVVTGTDYPGGLNSCSAIDALNSTVSAAISNPQPSATNLVMNTMASSNPVDKSPVTGVSTWTYTTVDREYYTVNATVFGSGSPTVPGYSTASFTIGTAPPVVLDSEGSDFMIDNKVLDIPGGTKITITLLTTINGYGFVSFALGTPSLNLTENDVD